MPRDVLVVGGGPAGMEAARVAAERGHSVKLVEREPQLGGQFRLAGQQPSRGQILDLIAWYARRLAALGVDVRLDTAATAADVRSAGADAVVLATGANPPGNGFQRALPMIERLPGAERDDAVSIHDVLAGRNRVTGRVVLSDDLNDWRGLGTALHLAEAGHEVTIVTAAPTVGAGLFHSAADVPLRRRFAAAGGAMRPDSVVLRWDGAQAVIRSTLTGAEESLSADTLVIAETPVAETTLAAELTRIGVAFEAIGDCVAPRRASLAFYEARELALRL